MFLSKSLVFIFFTLIIWCKTLVIALLLVKQILIINLRINLMFCFLPRVGTLLKGMFFEFNQSYCIILRSRTYHLKYRTHTYFFVWGIVRQRTQYEWRIMCPHYYLKKVVPQKGSLLYYYPNVFNHC